MAFIGASLSLHRMRMREYDSDINWEAIRKAGLRKQIDQKIQESSVLFVNEDQLRQAIDNASKIYVYDENNLSHVLKNSMTFNYSSSYRQNKSDNRSKQWIDDLDNGKDPKQVLLNILTGPGGKGVDSLKYKILSELTESNAKNYEVASLYVERTIHALNTQPHPTKTKRHR